MNLRTLKKLSKRAAPLLPLLGDARKQFPAETHDNYGVPFIGDRKHWDRSRCHPTYEGRNGWLTPAGAEVVFTTRRGHTVVMRPPSHPRKGTVMVGSVEGYYEPEWNEESAYCSLLHLLSGHFMDVKIDEDGEPDFVATRHMSTPREVFQAADAMLADLSKGGRPNG